MLQKIEEYVTKFCIDDDLDDLCGGRGEARVIPKKKQSPDEVLRTFKANLELHNEETCPVLEDVEVPKVLGDLVEAIMGAVFLDSGNNY